MSVSNSVYIVIIGRNVSGILASTIFKVRIELEGQKDIRIVFIDNGSTDGSSEVAIRSGAEVKKYSKVQRMNVLMGKAIKDAIGSDRDVNIFLDLSGENDADDAISLVRAAAIQGPNFAGGWINPRNENGKIGCLALDRKNLVLLSGPETDLDSFIEKMLSSNDYRKNMYREIVKKRSKMKEGSKQRFNPHAFIRNLRRNHPMKFYGSLGLISMVGAMATGFYTVDYFYKNQNLYYPTAFGTALLIMIGGFMLVAGLMLNAMNVVEERVKAMKKWESASEDFRW
jgi:glycosyltransferase involved in cell wall biosynthesis